MAKTLTNLGLMLVALLLILACATTATPPPPGYVDTAIAGTYSVAASQTARAKGLEASTQSLTPTASRMPSATAPASFTAVVLGASELQALADVPCRRGPGSAYERVFLFRKGSTAALVGRSPDGNYWIIRNPNRPEQLCWVERFITQINRLSGNVVVMTVPPPPTPTRTPSRTRRPPATTTSTPGPATATRTETATPVVQFDLLYSGLDDCAFTTYWVNFEVGNTGDFDFESLTITITDNDVPPATPLTLDSELFSASDGCNPPMSVDTLLIGDSHVVSSAPLMYNPTGHHIDATITLWTDVTQTGAFVTRTMSVIP